MLSQSVAVRESKEVTWLLCNAQISGFIVTSILKFVPSGDSGASNFRRPELRLVSIKQMLNEHLDVDKQVSLYYCKAKYGNYGLFATYPLRIAVLKADQYEFPDVERKLKYSRANHISDPEFANYFNGLTYEDKDYFSVEEIRFLFQLSAPCQPLSDNQLDSDLKEVATDIKRGKNMLKSHARIILKAIQYWESWYNEKFGEWFQEFSVASTDWWERRATGQGVLSPRVRS